MPIVPQEHEYIQNEGVDHYHRGRRAGGSGFAQGALKQESPERHGMNPEKLAQVDRVINEAITAKEIPGAVLSVVRGNDIVYLKAYGNKSVVPTVEPMTTETLFDLASVSKCVGTTLAFMQLIENGYVRLTDNVDRYIPNFKPWKDPESGETVDITIRDLLSHSSGLTPYINADTFVKEYGGNDPEKWSSTSPPRSKGTSARAPTLCTAA